MLWAQLPLTSGFGLPSDDENVIAQFERIAKLRADGILSDDEFAKLKAIGNSIFYPSVPRLPLYRNVSANSAFIFA